MNIVRISWEDNNGMWNETCAWVLEHFGLPGDRFTTDLCKDFMDFRFKNQQDALLCALGIGGELLVDQ